MNDREYLDLNQIQQEELKMLSSLDSFCVSHGLYYTLLYGTLIGAIRHQGFIPWDDDIDVGIPRPDYNWLVSNRRLFEEETGYTLVGLKGLPLDAAPIAKVVNQKIGVNERGAVTEGSLWIDVFPIDSLPESETDAKKLCSRIQMLRLLFVAITSPVSSARTISRKIVKLLLQPLKLIIRPADVARRINELSTSTRFGTTDVVNALTWTNYGFEGRFAYEALGKQLRLPFENSLYYVIPDYDRNLTGIYGDYMTLPDEKDRATHSVTAWRRRDL